MSLEIIKEVSCFWVVLEPLKFFIVATVLRT